MNYAAIILAGGESRRMGRPKASLPFGGQTLLTRILSTVQPLVERCFVVKATDQTLPAIPSDVEIVEDRAARQGPLEGIAAGLAAARDYEAAFVGSCDTPLLSSKVVAYLFQQLEANEIAAVRTPEFVHPLCAVYRTSVAERADALLASEQRRPRFLIDACQTRYVDAETLRQFDPPLYSLWNLNTPAEYERALRVVEKLS